MTARLGFSPLCSSWIWFALFAVLLLAFLASGLIVWFRTRTDSEAGAIDWIRRSFIVLVLLALAVGPSIVSTSASTAVSSTTVVMAVDVTGSMAVGDAQYGSSQKMTRLDAARHAIDDLLKLYAGARFEAISFGSSANVDVPSTADAQAVRSWAEGLEVEPTSVSAGSSLSQPLDTLIRSMQEIRARRHSAPIAFYYISDGEQTSRGGRRTFSTLRQFVTTGATIGVGSAAGGRVPLVTAANARRISISPTPIAPNGYVTDPMTHKPGISQMSRRELSSIADEFSGQSLVLGPTTTIARLTSGTSLRYRLAQGQKRHRSRTLVVWPQEIALFLLLLWELAVDVMRARRYV